VQVVADGPQPRDASGAWGDGGGGHRADKERPPAPAPYAYAAYQGALHKPLVAPDAPAVYFEQVILLCAQTKSARCRLLVDGTSSCFGPVNSSTQAERHILAPERRHPGLCAGVSTNR